MVGFGTTKLTRVWEPALLWNQLHSEPYSWPQTASRRQPLRSARADATAPEALAEVLAELVGLNPRPTQHETAVSW